MCNICNTSHNYFEVPARRFQGSRPCFQDYSQCCQGSTKCPRRPSSRNQSPAPQAHQLCIPAWVFWVPARISRAPASSHVLWNNFCCRAGLYTYSETIFVWQFGGPQPDLHVLRNNFQAIIQHYFNNFCICLVIFYIFWWFMARNMVFHVPSEQFFGWTKCSHVLDSARHQILHLVYLV